MSEKSSGTCETRKVTSDRRSLVKSLILEFEQLGVNDKGENVGMLRMGVEHSNSAKSHSRSATINSKSLVKQRVSQFDVKLDSENQYDKRKRHKSTTENNTSQANPSKDFQRSKSVDYTRREKDRYLRSRQISPKIKEDAFKFDTSSRRTASSNDSNNNSLQKKSTRRKTSQESAAKAGHAKDKTASIKTNPKLSERCEIAESAPVTLKRREKVYTDSFKIIKKDTSTKDKKSETVPKASIKRNIRSVKSIKKVFDGPEQKFSVVDHKILKNKELSDLDRVATITNDSENDQDRLSSNKRRESDKKLSERLSDKTKVSANFDLEAHTEDYLFDKNKEEPHETQNSLVGFKQNTINGIAGNKDDVDLAQSYSEDEFNQIERSLQEMEQTVREIEEHHSQAKLFTENKEKTKIDEKEELNLNETEMRDFEKRKLEETVNEYLEEIENGELEPENINVYIPKFIEDELEDEFGQRSFGSFESINFTEAYNRAGDELIVTSVAAVERRSISESSTGKEFSLENSGNKTLEDRSLSNAKKETSGDDIFEENTLEETNSITGEPDNAVENKLYFSREELQQESESEIMSNRSTLYSSTNTNSTESIERYGKAESDEGIEFEKDHAHIYEEIRLENNVEIRSICGGGYDRAIKTETIYDSFQNPRIAKVSNVNSEDRVRKAETPLIEETEQLELLKSPSSLKPKKDYIIEELIETERKYIKHLEKVVWDYMPVITDDKLPPSLIGKSHYLFGNIKKIYSTTQKFYKALKSCGNDHEEIAKTFLNFKHLFELYPLYSKNKPAADQYLQGDFKDLVAAREKQLNDRLGLASNLLTPIQRLGKYILFLEQIQKELLKKEGLASDNIYKAIQTVRKQMSRGNDFIAIDSIKDCPISLLEQGSFIMREKFNVVKPRKYEAMLFLFEEILVFTTVDPRNPEMFVYRDSIKLNEMGIVTFDDQPLVFHLKRFPSYKKGPKEHHEFVIEAKKNKDKRTWTEQIEKRLWEQLVKCKEEQRELHSNQGKRNSVIDLPDRIRKKKAGYSSLPSEMRKHSTKSIFYYKVDSDA